MKKKKILIAILILIIIGTFCAGIFSYFKFRVINPFSSTFGMIQILYSEKKYTIVQNYPNKVIFAKPDKAIYALDEYMKSIGFKNLEDEQMGSIIVYSNGSVKEMVDFSVNGYYSKWIWQ